MIGRHERDTTELLPAPAQPGDAAGNPEQPFDRGGSEGNDHPGLNHINLRQQIRQTGLHLFGCRLAVSGRLARSVGTAFQDVRNIDCVAPEAHHLDDLREQLPCLADERFALRIFIRAGSLAHEHQR